MNRIAFYASHNAPKKRDGDEFTREARNFQLVFSSMDAEIFPAVNLYELPQARGMLRRASFEGYLRSLADMKITAPIGHMAIFGHGTVQGIPAIGVQMRHVPDIAYRISEIADPDRFVLSLFCCSCGKLADAPRGTRKAPGVAYALTEAIAALGIHVRTWAHTTAGHTTRNPHCIAIEGTPVSLTRPPSMYVNRFAVPGSKRWKKWRALQKTNFRFVAGERTDSVLLAATENLKKG